jgi:hypothetical protein
MKRLEKGRHEKIVAKGFPGKLILRCQAHVSDVEFLHEVKTLYLV